MKKKINKRIPKYKFGAAEVSEAVSTTANGVASAMGVSQGSPVGGTLKGIGAGLSAIPTPYTQVAGAVLSTVGSFWGEDGSVDPNTGEIRKGSGLSKLFGRSDRSLAAESNRIKTSIADREITEHLNYKYYSDPNNTANTNMVYAAEGGIMNDYVMAAVSPGELEIDPVTLEYYEYPGDNGKPNSKDNIEKPIKKGKMIASHAEHMKMDNGKTPADNSKMILDSKMPEEMKRKMIKKIFNWQEENKTKPQEYAKFDEGIYYVDGQRAEYRHGRWWWNEGGKKDAQGKMYFVPYTGKSTPSETEPIKYTSETSVGPLDPAYRQHVRYSSTNDVERKATVSKPFSSKKTTTASRVTTSTALSPEDSVLRRPERVYDYEEPAKAVTTQVYDKKVYGRDGSVRYDYTSPERKVTPEDLGRTTNNDNNGYTGSNWRDGLYRMAVLSQPLWDRAKAEPIDYTLPVYKYMPTQIDVSSQLRDADQSYALSRYNFANLYPNTGAGMAAGLQAASNRAKQYADVRQWQTNAQNELIGKNVGIYNNWANEHARILNDVYNKSAQNRAAARNINRQNKAAWLSNWGTILRDDKQFAADLQNKELQTEALKPLIQSVYENSDTLIPMLAQYTVNKNIKKKSPTR